jgi:ABC-type dipeptide/oligopeptide/nickel transport system permease subunit
MTSQIGAISQIRTPQQASNRALWGLALRRFTRNRLAVVGAIVMVVLLIAAFGAPLLAPYAYDQADFTAIWKSPTPAHLLGTDKVGRDVFSRLIYGTRTSLIVSLSVQAIVLTVGITIGAVSGMLGGRFDYVVMRAVDVVASFPTLLFAILLMSAVGQGVPSLILALSITSWVLVCQLTRAQILSLREREFVLASESFGARTGWIIRSHLVPNIIPPLIVSSTLAIPSYIVAEAGLGFLGIGINPPTPSLGQQINEASTYVIAHPDYMLFTAVAVAILILSIAYIGDGLREALDPRALS